MKRKVKDIIKMRNGSTITITNNSTKDAGKGFNEIYLKEHDEYYCRDLTTACDKCLEEFEEWRKEQDIEN